MSSRRESGMAFHAEQFFERRPRTANIRFIGVLSPERGRTSIRNRDAYDVALRRLDSGSWLAKDKGLPAMMLRSALGKVLRP